MFAIQVTAVPEIGGGRCSASILIYPADREPPASGSPHRVGNAAQRPGWNVLPAQGSNAYGSGWGEENDGMG